MAKIRKLDSSVVAAAKSALLTTYVANATAYRSVREEFPEDCDREVMKRIALLAKTRNIQGEAPKTAEALILSYRIWRQGRIALKATQTARQRVARLARGCCPIHGIPMLQVGLTDVVATKQAFIAKCPRRDCDIQGTTGIPFGPIALMPAFKALLGPVAVSAE